MKHLPAIIIFAVAATGCILSCFLHDEKELLNAIADERTEWRKDLEYELREDLYIDLYDDIRDEIYDSLRHELLSDKNKGKKPENWK